MKNSQQMSFLSLKKRFKKKIKQKIEIFVEELFKKRFDKKINIKNTIPKSTKITNSSLGGNIAIGERVLISNCEIFGNITIGNNTSLNGPNTDIHCMVNAVKIGNFCSIARNVSIQEYNHYFSHTTSYFIKHHIFEEDWTKEINSKGNIEIGNDVWIGTQCVILSGAKIGNGAVIAANSVVTKEIPPFAIAAGNPAKVIKYRFSDAIIQKLIEIKWWDWSLEKIKQNYTFFNGELSLEKFNHIK